MKIERRFVGALHALRHQRGHAPERPLHEIYQASTINALLEGVYDGDMTFGELRRHGDFGLGTFNALDGEMVAFDDQFWQVRSDGSVSRVSDDQRLPFATVVSFRPTLHRDLDGPLDYDALKRRLDAIVGSPNLFHAIRIDGHFRQMRTRSILRQTPPYQPFAEIAESQPVFDLGDAEGTLVGFRFPDFTEGLNVPGYHLHFLTKDATGGGHVQALVLEHGRLAVDDESNIHIELPTDEDFLAADLGGDHSADLKKAEQ